jgi:hypothetical protein
MQTASGSVAPLHKPNPPDEQELLRRASITQLPCEQEV